MRSSRRNKLAAVTVFVVIAAGVVGGMSWGTYNSYSVAEEHVKGEISRAVWEMSNYMAGIINSEAARGWTDYLSFQETRDFAAYSHQGVELNADYVVLPSPLTLSPPPHDWIDVYFQLDPHGDFSSPQLISESEPWPFEQPLTSPTVENRARQTADWLKTVLPQFDYEERCRVACVNAHFLGAGAAREDAAETRLTEGATASKVGERVARTRASQRQQVLQDAQAGYIRTTECFDARIAERNLLNLVGTTTDPVDEELLKLSGEVSVTTDLFTVFWLGPGPTGEWKLAFLRECHADALVFYQGFIGDWGRLEPELLAQIEDDFPDAELLPVLNDEHLDPREAYAHMSNLPVRLQLGSVSGGTAAVAWRRIRGTLLGTWAAAIGVLILAAWGLRNLVALTERRMQFAYAVTHELRTPLTTFRLYSDMLSAGLVPASSKQQYLDTLNAESIRLSSVVEDVLEYARLENHKVKLNPSDTNGDSLLGVIEDSLDKRCRANGIESRSENMLANGQRVRTDVDLVNRIAGVLVSNACRYARGCDKPLVLVRLEGDESHINLHVIDSGPGIDRIDARTIFKPFRRGRRTDVTRGGIGLGLALARSWAQLLGGRLELAAGHHPKHGGAHFRLTIPATVRI